MEADTPEYWQYRIDRWIKKREIIVNSLGEKYYLEYLERFKMYLKESKK